MVLLFLPILIKCLVFALRSFEDQKATRSVETGGPGSSQLELELIQIFRPANFALRFFNLFCYFRSLSFIGCKWHQIWTILISEFVVTSNVFRTQGNASRIKTLKGNWNSTRRSQKKKKKEFSNFKTFSRP